MSAILQLIEAANAEAERLRHVARATKRPATKRILEQEAVDWAYLAAAARAEFELLR